MTVLSAAAERFLAGQLLAEVDADARLALFRALKEDFAPRGSNLLEEGRRNDRLWFLIEGEAQVFRRNGGAEQAIAHINAPGIFGATSFFRPTAPTATVRAATDVGLLVLDHAAHDRLRRNEPRAAEALALATVRALAERFDLLDLRFTEYLATRPDDQSRANEWANFRARLFEEPNII
jgi:CRP/FNR family transcriptional regulator, cyclic AMP receptor protein